MNLGICFSGGGIKGAAHIGALKAFEENNITFNYISGTSSGSIVASLYSMGYKAEEIKKIFVDNYKKIKYIENKKILILFFGIIFKRKIIIDGLNSGEKIEKILNKYFNKKGINNINQIKKILLIPSVNMETGEIVYFSSVNHAENNREYLDNNIYINDIDIGKAVHASCSYPGVFSPCKYNDYKLIDGGIRENTPWKELKKIGADKIICINFYEKRIKQLDSNIFNVIENSIKILNHELANYELKDVDYIIKIKSESVNLLDMSKFDCLYNLGYKEGKKFIKNKLNK